MPKKDQKKVYIIGIGGKGLNSIAEFCLSKGYEILGSDIKQSPETDSLIKKGVHINFTQTKENINDSLDVVVHSSIIKKDHPEIMMAHELGLKVLERAQFLHEITKDYVRISVAGSHGKSTTSALATLALKETNGEVNAITGSHIKELGSYQSSGDSPYCVLEACEYGKSFLHIPGDYTLITSLEKSHMEFFETEEKMNDAFSQFVQVHKSNAILIINGDYPKLREVCSTHLGKVITCGFNTSNDYVIKNVELSDGSSTFSLYKGENCIVEKVQIQIPGTYNILNAALVFVLLNELNLPFDKYLKILNSFRGVGRRFEISQLGETIFVDDFAHHPTQVRNLLKGLKQFFPGKDIFAVFEPRQYHLIRTFLKEYGKAFSLADEVYITDIVPALGDTVEDVESLTTADVLKSVTQYSKPSNIEYVASYGDIVTKLRLKNLSNAVIATIGAGGVFQVRDMLINKI